MENLSTVLVGIDYSDPSDNALREAFRIARWDGAKLVVLNILDDRVLERAKREIDLPDDKLLLGARDRLHQHVEDVIGSGYGALEIEFIVGHPFEELMKKSESAGADLIVLGSHGVIDDEPHRLGTLVTRVVRKAKTNVLIVRDRQDSPFTKVCACIDFSEPSRFAGLAATHIAQQDEAALDFLHVHQPIGGLVAGTGFFVGDMPIYSPENDAEIVRRTEEKLLNVAAELADGYPHQTHVYNQTSLRGGIVEYLKNSAPDLVVMSARGHATIRNLLIGSTAEKIIHEADCSTLVIKPGGFHYDLE